MCLICSGWCMTNSRVMAPNSWSDLKQIFLAQLCPNSGSAAQQESACVVGVMLGLMAWSWWHKDGSCAAKHRVVVVSGL